MVKLFFLTQLSDLVIHEALQNTNALFVSPIPEVHNKLIEIGISSQYISSFHHDKGDSLFFQEFMPGKLDGLNIDDFPLWKSLSIDRFRFWYNPSSLPEILQEIHYDELIISIDMFNNLPWEMARLSNVPVTGIKTHSLRTREFYTFYPYSNLNHVIVSFDDEKELLRSACPEISVNVFAGKRPQRIESQKKEELRNGLQIPKNIYVTGVIFDKRDEWQFRKFLGIVKEKNLPLNLIAFPYDNRSDELFSKCISNDLRHSINLRFMDNSRLIGVCDELVMFRFLEDLYGNTPNIPLAIYDWYNLNLSKELSLEGIKVYT